MLYELLAGRRVFTGEDVSDTLAAVLRSDVAWQALPAETPAHIHGLLGRCLTRDPTERLRDIGEARIALRGGSAPADAAAGGATGASAIPPVAHRRRLAGTVVAAVAVTAVVSAALTAGIGSSLRPSPPREVMRFAHELSASHVLRNQGYAVLAVAPDGRRFVYNTTDGLYLRSLDALEARLLPGTAESVTTPVFSPDGQSLAYFAGGVSAGQLKRLALGGGAPVVICDARNPGGLSWAVDGTLLFGQPEGIMRVPATGGTPTPVVPAADGEVLDGPQLLPGGDAVLFSVTTSGFRASRWNTAQLAVQSLSSGERTVLLQGGADARYLPTGHLVYSVADGLFAAAFDPARPGPLSGPVSVVQGVVRAGFTASANYGVANDGTLVYLAGGPGIGSPLAWVDRRGAVETIATIPPGGYTTPRLSHDGERVLVVAGGDLWIYELASGRERRLTTDGLTAGYADWTPSGAEVTYSSGRGSSGQENVWIQPADGSGTPRQVTALDGQVHVDAWAQDGRTLSAHHHTSGPTNQLMVPVDGGAGGQPAVWLERAFEAVFSPDGRYVAYVSEQSGQRDLPPAVSGPGRRHAGVGRRRRGAGVGRDRRAVLSAAGRLPAAGGRGGDRSGAEGRRAARAVPRDGVPRRLAPRPLRGERRRAAVPDERRPRPGGRGRVRRPAAGARRAELGRGAEGARAGAVACGFQASKGLQARYG